MSGIDAVLFDMDGLMFDTESLYFESNRATLEEMGYVYSLDHYQEIIGKSGDEFIEKMLEIVETKEAYDYFIETADAHFLKHIKENPVGVKPGLYELLAYLDEVGAKKSVVSSSDSNIIDVLLDKTDLLDTFDHVVGSDMVTHTKPHPEPYLKALDLGETDPSLVWVLEDSLSGLKSADAAGLRKILIPDLVIVDEECQKIADHVMTDLHEVKEFFKG